MLEILNYIKDIPSALLEILKFLPNFIGLVINIIDILPTPIDMITFVSIPLFSAIFIVKIARGK